MAKKQIQSGLGGINQQNQELAGIPDSPIFRREVSEAENPTLDCHVGGVLVRDLPLEAQGRILYQQTDEGIAEYNAGKTESRVSVTRDEFAKALDHRRDAVKDFGMNLDEAPNPMKEAMAKHIKPGFRGRFLSPAICDRRGMRNWEPVLDEHGNQVKVQKQFLAQMPEAMAVERNKQVREKGNRLLDQVKQQYLQEGGQTAVSD